MHQKKILILGSTGSIGVNTLNVIREFPEQFKAVALTANSNTELLKEQIAEFRPEAVVVRDKQKAKQLKQEVTGCEILAGDDGLIQLTRRDNYDVLLSALVGFAGLAPTIESIKLGKRIALANKETLVVAGELVMSLCKQYEAELLPVDSEHSAIFQCMVGERTDEIHKLILTASGGPFRNKSKEELLSVSIEQALDHPNWSMGSKITIDSATMMNKGLEVIEAHWIFDLPKEKIDVVVHPQSIIHSMIEFIDGSIKAQLSLPDMRLPIQYALTYPDRLPSKFVDTNFPKLRELTFYEPDLDTFRCLKLAYDVMQQGGTAPCILNAANEVAVDKFLNGKIKFHQIPEAIESALDKITNHKTLDFETIFECDSLTREYVEKLYN